MQVKLTERVLLHQSDRLSAEPFSKAGEVLNTNCQRSPAITQIHVIEADVADERAGFDDLRIAVLHEALHPTISGLCGHRTYVAGAAPIHAHNLGMDPQNKTRGNVLWTRRAQQDGPADEYGQH
jgi:hypothetical protein